MGRAQQSHQVLHNHVRPAVSSGQTALVASLPLEQRLSLSIVLPLRNQAALSSLLGRLYDPSSPDYHQFLSVAQFTDQFAPTLEDYQAVVSYAQANGFTVTGYPCESPDRAHQRLGSADQPGIQSEDESLPASHGESHILLSGS
jgi:Pro-kumamolisin, activation domain